MFLFFSFLTNAGFKSQYIIIVYQFYVILSVDK